MRDRNRFVACCFRELNSEVAEASHADDGDAVARLRLGDPESAPHREARAENRRGLFVVDPTV
jgi:hypothetical protein